MNKSMRVKVLERVNKLEEFSFYGMGVENGTDKKGIWDTGK